MEGAADAGREMTAMGKVAFASFIGTAIEFYDFYILVLLLSSGGMVLAYVLFTCSSTP